MIKSTGIEREREIKKRGIFIALPVGVRMKRAATTTTLHSRRREKRDEIMPSLIGTLPTAAAAVLLELACINCVGLNVDDIMAISNRTRRGSEGGRRARTRARETIDER